MRQSPYHLDTAHIDWGDDNVPRSSRYGDVYYSREQGLAETRYVFLDNNHLAQRWRALAPGDVFSIGETGFGTGLNFLATWQLWRSQAPKNARLHFISVEKHPLRLADLTRALSHWPELAALASQLQAQYPPPLRGHHRLLFEQRRIVLDLLLDDAAHGLGALLASNHREFVHKGAKIDAWFLDGFAPGKNPGMWSQDLFEAIAALSHPDTTFATFTAAGEVKRGLQARGFSVDKVAGFGRKRDMLRGTMATEKMAGPLAAQAHETAAWHFAPALRKGNVRHVAIIGAGLAGCHSARALAERGLQVSVIDRHGEPAAEASGNPQGILYTKLSHQAGLLNRFALQSFLFAARTYRQMATMPGNLCGVLQLVRGDREYAAFEKIRNAFTGSGDTIQFLTPDAATRVAGITLEHPAIYFPYAGWLRPDALCRQLLDHENITVQTACDVHNLLYADGQWHLTASKQLAPADALIVANSTGALQFELFKTLPLKAVRGQLTYVSAEQLAAEPHCVICHEGYIAPPVDGRFVLGASFDTQGDELNLRQQDHNENLAKLRAAIPALTPEREPKVNGGRAALRCTTPDYLPLVGPAPDIDAMRDVFAPLTKNAKSYIASAPPYHPGLYLNLAHGSRGLTSAPLAAEIIAAQICGELSPVPRDLLRALSPSRFVIRALIRHNVISENATE